MLDVVIFLFCAATGFAMAGTITSFYQLVTAQPADFLTLRKSVSGNVIAVLLTMFGGPFIVARKVMAGVRSGHLTLVPAAFGLAITVIWSVCAGIFFLHLLIAA